MVFSDKYHTMSKKLEELFNLPPAESITVPEETDASTALEESKKQEATLSAADDAINKIDAALPTVRDLEASDKEMDELADLAKDTFTELVKLAMDVEPRFSGTIIQSASNLLGHAVTAKMAKIDKKLKMVDLQIKKARLDQAAAESEQFPAPLTGKGTVIDRNELLKSILANAAETKKAAK